MHIFQNFSTHTYSVYSDIILILMAPYKATLNNLWGYIVTDFGEFKQ
jgi:hypothetical protein